MHLKTIAAGAWQLAAGHDPAVTVLVQRLNPAEMLSLDRRYSLDIKRHALLHAPSTAPL